MRKRNGLLAAAMALTIGLATADAGTLVVLNKSEANVSFLDTATGETKATFDVGVGPHEAATSPDGRTVVVCNYGDQRPGSTLSVIKRDGRSMKVSEIPLGKYQRPHGIVYLSDGERVVVTSETQRALLMVHVATGEIEAAIDTGQNVSHMVAITPDEKLALVANIGSGSASVIDLEKRELVKAIPTGAGAEGVAAHPTRPEVWVTNRAADTVSIIDTNTLEVTDTLESGDFAIRVAITSDGRHALVSCAGSGEVWVYDVATREVVKRISMDEQPVGDDEKEARLFSDQFGASPAPVGVLIEPGDARAYVANTNADVVTVLDLKTWSVVGRLRTGKEPDGMTWVK